MAAKLQEIEGRFRGEKFRFGDCLVGEIELVNGSSEIAEAAGHRGMMLAIKGDADPDELQHRQSYRFYGRFANYRNKRSGENEKQFHFQTFVAARQHDREGVIAYLEQAGRGNGMGRGTAAKAWEAFGSEAVRILREDPAQLRAVNNRITREQSEAIAANLVRQRATEDATIELTNLLAGRGLPKTTARNAIKEWGNRAASQIKRDPYALMRFRGCGFKLCDSLWIELGLSRDRLRRQALCAWYSIASNSDGHTWHPVEMVAKAVQQAIGATNARPKRAIQLATRLGRLSVDHYGALAALRSDGANGPIVDEGGRVWLAEGRKAEAERSLARMVCEALDEARPRSVTAFDTVELSFEEAVELIQCRRCGRQLTAPEVHVWNGLPFGPTCIGHISDGTDVEIVALADWIDQQPPIVRKIVEEAPRGRITLPAFSLWPDPSSIKEIDAHQRSKLADALMGRVAILGGSPGTGKTYVTAQMVRALLRTGAVGVDDIAVGAPTGKAAVRITEAMQAAGLPLRARTWHSLLGVGQADGDSGNWGFLHNESNPWSYRVVIGDESSMLDTSLMCSIFRARPRGCHMLLVGDVHQLPPVGHGAPLRDLIAAGVPYGELTEIKRNSGGIVEACAAIRDGEKWDGGDNLEITDSRTPPEQIGHMLRSIHQATQRGLDPVWDCQILVAVNARSPLSRKILNERLQHELNPNPKVPGTPFRVADKIVCLKNGRYPVIDLDADAEQTDDGEVYVANGELASIEAIESGYLVASLANPKRIIRIPRGKASSDDGDDEKAASTGCSWDLGYALSVHKSQGSEWPVSIVMLDEYPGARMVCSREWLYTAISRAKELCVMVGRKATADSMCRRVAIGKRKTFLRELIHLRTAEKVLETL